MNKVFISCKESRIENNRSFYGCFSLGSFDYGLSLTIANALRRTLLSECAGLGIVSVTIENVTHEYSTLLGVRESVLDILLNLKEIVFKKTFYYKKEKNGHGDQSSPWHIYKKKLSVYEQIGGSYFRPIIGYLKVKGPGVIRAKDLILPPFIQCVDPEQYIATLSEDGSLCMKFIIMEGKNDYIQKKNSFINFNLVQKRQIFLNELFSKKNDLISPSVSDPSDPVRKKRQVRKPLFQEKNVSPGPAGEEDIFHSFHPTVSLEGVQEAPPVLTVPETETSLTSPTPGQSQSDPIGTQGTIVSVSKGTEDTQWPCYTSEEADVSDVSGKKGPFEPETYWSQSLLPTNSAQKANTFPTAVNPANNGFLREEDSRRLQQTVDGEFPTNSYTKGNTNLSKKGFPAKHPPEVKKGSLERIEKKFPYLTSKKLRTLSFQDSFHASFEEEGTKIKSTPLFINSMPLHLDTVFNPVTKVNYIIEENLNKLVEDSNKKSMFVDEITSLLESSQYLKKNLPFITPVLNDKNFSNLVNTYVTSELNNLNSSLHPLKKETKEHTIFLEIWTNGSIHPSEVLKRGLTSLSSVFLSLEKI